MIRRDVIAGGGAGARDERQQAGTQIPDMHIELAAADHEEPTWEVRPVGEPKRRRLDRRTRAILTCAAVAAIVVNAGAAWLYWQVSGSETVEAGSGSVSMALRARSDLDLPLRRGGKGDLTVTVTNDYGFPVRITELTRGAGNVVADDEHREAGCTSAPVEISAPRFDVSWDVQRNTIGAFTVPGGLVMRPDAHPACDGAVFTIPVQVSGAAKSQD